MTHAEYGASRTAAARWTGVAALFTDQDGRIVLEEVDYRDVCLPPGGGVDIGEPPSAAMRREAQEELGLLRRFARVLAVDWIPPTAPGHNPAMGFPGEIITVFDGGALTEEDLQSVRLPGREVIGLRHVEPAHLGDHMASGDARRLMAALRARINGAGPAVLEDGRPLTPSLLDKLQMLRTARKPQRWAWRGEPVTPGLPVRQSWGWLFAPDGRVLVLIGQDTGSACLPGGTLEPRDHGDPTAALHREAQEEAQVSIGEPLYLGYLYDNTGQEGQDAAGPCARVRMAACITTVGPSGRDEASSQTYTRVLATVEQAAELFDWGPDTRSQTEAAHAAREQLRLPRPARQPVTELQPG
ncbi:NUDIX hydrolase [Streptomyces sp. CA-111067]|uniref:NUDIX hydrolase n=1 Tax=Streptomyces sp. CA-111067 TaxID=3240046 RepID=UPI003D993080